MRYVISPTDILMFWYDIMFSRISMGVKAQQKNNTLACSNIKQTCLKQMINNIGFNSLDIMTYIASHYYIPHDDK